MASAIVHVAGEVCLAAIVITILITRRPAWHRVSGGTGHVV